jgi:hypothetical protein
MSEVNQNRRSFLRGFLVAAAVTSVGMGAESVAFAADGDRHARRYLLRMLAGLDVGEPFFFDWSLIDAYPPRAGGVILVVAKGESAPIRVDVCRRGNPTIAPAYTRHLELFVMDGGAGDKLLPRDMVEALQFLAEVLQDNEAQWLLAESLLTHQERIQRYPKFMSRAACELAPANIR